MAATSRAFRLLIASILLTVVATPSAQKNQPGKLPAAPPAGTITEQSILGHMGFLASDAMNGRGSGSADEWRAAEYIGTRMLSWGIEPLGDNGGFVQKIDTGVVRSSTAPVVVVGANAMVLTHGREMLVQSINKGAVSGPLYRYAFGSPVPDGAFVFVPDGVTPDNAALAKAAGMFTVETPQIRTAWAATGARMPTAAAAGGGRGGGAPAPPIVRIVLDKATHAAMAGMVDGTKIDFQTQTEHGFTYNAVGRLKGSDPLQSAEVILLTAHLDHLGNTLTGGRCSPLRLEDGVDNFDTICNGADDDASGSTAVLELAEAIAKGPRPKRTVLFAWFGSEEAGGYGARNFLEKPLVPQSAIVANLEFEMIGRSDPAVAAKTLWLTGYERSNLGVELAKQGARLVQDPHPDQNFFSRSDNIQLARAGVIAHTVSSFNLHKEYHTAADDIAHIDFAHMTMAIQSMYAPVMWLTNSNFKPTWYPNCQPVAPPRAVPGQPAPPPPPPCKANGK
jgi:hypothetical protein